MTRLPAGWDVESPVKAEVFVVWLRDDHLELTGPCGAAPWILELGATDHPVAVVDRIVRARRRPSKVGPFGRRQPTRRAVAWRPTEVRRCPRSTIRRRRSGGSRTTSATSPWPQ